MPVWAFPGRNGEDDGSVFGNLSTEVTEKVLDNGAGDVFDLFEFDVGGWGREGLAEVCFGGDGGDWRLPSVGLGVALLESKVGFAEPFEVSAAVFDHAGFEIGAVGGEAHEEGFLENDAGATKWVKQAALRFWPGAKVNKDLGEFWGEHADARVTSGPCLVALGVAGDTLDLLDDSGVLVGNQ